jgi:predicted Rossmann fold nucleotide-binding protein DprA/Smf involved in DNA uptake
MNLSRRTLGLCLALTPGVGAKTILRVFTRNDLLCRSNSDFLKFQEEILQEEYGFNLKSAQAWIKNRKYILDQAKELEARLDRLNVQMITACDAHFPRKLEEMDADSPGLLYVYGNTRLLQSDLFTVLSSRKSSASALDLIGDLTQQGVQRGEVLVSGHSTQEYQSSAVVPLRWGAPRVLVLDRGLFSALGENLTEELFTQARLWRYEFDPKTDLVISFVNPASGYFPSCNATRDRLIAALSNRIDFVTINPQGNMKQLALRALEVGKTVRVSSLTENHEYFIEHGAQLVRSVA